MPLVTTVAQFDAALRDLSACGDALVVDTETTGLHMWLCDNPARLCGIVIGHAFEPGHDYYFPFRHATGTNLDLELLEPLRKLLQGKRRMEHHAQFDEQILHCDGFELAPELLDTIGLSHLCNENEDSFSLKQLGVKYVDPGAAAADEALQTLLRSRKLGKGDIATLAPEEVAQYGLQDINLTRLLYANRYNELRRWGLEELYGEINEYLLALIRMQIRGIRLDVDEVERQMANIGPRLEAVRARIIELTGNPEANPNSSQQMKEWLKLPSTKSALLKEVLARDKREDVKLLLEYRSLFKAKSGFFVPLLGWRDLEDRVHTSYKITPVTGRLSSSDPNCQQFSRDEGGRAYSVRSCLVPSPGYFLVDADYAAIEPRIASHFSNDPTMQKAFHEDIDFHRTVAQAMFRKNDISNDERTSAKTLGLSVLYGAGALTSAMRLNLKHEPAEEYHHELVWVFRDGDLKQVSCSEAHKEFCAVRGKEFIGKFYSGLPELKPFVTLVANKAKDNKYLRNPYTKRVLRFPDGRYHKAFNKLIQNTAAEVMRKALVALDRKYRNSDDVRLLLTTHDSAVLEIRYSEEAEAQVRDIKNTMENVMKFAVPLKVGVKYGLSLSNTAKFIA